MRVPFRTGSTRSNTVGYPRQARHCRCGKRRLFDGVNCTRCGYHTLAQIRATWALAAQLAGRGSDAKASVRELRSAA